MNEEGPLPKKPNIRGYVIGCVACDKRREDNSIACEQHRTQAERDWWDDILLISRGIRPSARRTPKPRPPAIDWEINIITKGNVK